MMFARQNNYLAALFPGQNKFGVSFIDISTGEFLTAEGDADYIIKLFQNLKPSEVIYPKSFRSKFENQSLFYFSIMFSEFLHMFFSSFSSFFVPVFQ